AGRRAAVLLRAAADAGGLTQTKERAHAGYQVPEMHVLSEVRFLQPAATGVPALRGRPEARRAAAAGRLAGGPGGHRQALQPAAGPAPARAALPPRAAAARR